MWYFSDKAQTPLGKNGILVIIENNYYQGMNNNSIKAVTKKAM